MKRGAAAGCEACATVSRAHLTKMGLKVDRWDHVVALAGNPNVGKSTIFNALTGLRQHTGNWPGKTITRAEGGFSFEDRRYKLVDLPGTYSLLSASEDEEVARNFILFARPDVTVVVVDATRLERNLNLVLQVLQITDRAVVALNLKDEARAYGIAVDERGLARDLGVPVVGTAARSEEGIDELLRMIDEVATGRYACRPYRPGIQVEGVDSAVEELTARIAEALPDVGHPQWIALRLLEGDERLRDAVRTGEIDAPGGVHEARVLTHTETAV